MIHQEGVFTCATKEACRLADTVTQITAGGESSLKPIRSSKAGVSFTFGLEDLPDLENIITGVTAIVQPGGSKRDDEVIEAANRLGLVLVHTGTRHFRH